MGAGDVRDMLSRSAAFLLSSGVQDAIDTLRGCGFSAAELRQLALAAPEVGEGQGSGEAGECWPGGCTLDPKCMCALVFMDDLRPPPTTSTPPNRQPPQVQVASCSAPCASWAASGARPSLTWSPALVC